ncbi:hypothetical protein NDU88_008481 [Pleurodeles waltl]|uniref:Uncharacterized protein n=1 Tax=Pleurodeles waltl TaxID=8319 RepID=A0AAV7RVK7_PLEWA|nr:hypothetical protein NDU88_008481 [Pleurodeles waltl]
MVPFPRPSQRLPACVARRLVQELFVLAVYQIINCTDVVWQKSSWTPHPPAVRDKGQVLRSALCFPGVPFPSNSQAVSAREPYGFEHCSPDPITSALGGGYDGGPWCCRTMSARCVKGGQALADGSPFCVFGAQNVLWRRRMLQ